MSFRRTEVIVPQYVRSVRARTMEFEGGTVEVSSGIYKTLKAAVKSFEEERSESGPSQMLGQWRGWIQRKPSGKVVSISVIAFDGRNFVLIIGKYVANDSEGKAKTEEIIRCVLLSWKTAK